VQPGRFNFRIYQGDTFSTAPAWKINNSYVNVTGYTADMQVRVYDLEVTSPGGTVTKILTGGFAVIAEVTQ